ncbi:MAG: B12-binding domain-containing radical SAM protein, partial [Planctomycetes bacterium]|nr:B12-binding domain-containing radical SAM protein [Planctomycetota bacterium]
MRILFIYPNIDCQIGFNYGLAFLSSVLQREGHETKLLNVNEKLDFPLDPDRICREVRDYDPDLVGFSVVTPQYQAARRIAEIVREGSDAPIVCGGIHPTMAPEETLQDECWDYICVGEGEDAIIDMVDRLESGESLKEISNIAYREDGEVVRNSLRPFKELTELPPKDYKLFDFQKMIDAKNGWVGLMASRGCPFRCSYCFNHRMVDLYQESTGLARKELNYIRKHPVDAVIAEIEYLLENYENIDTFIFDDDILTLEKDYLRDLCRRYAEVSDLPFVCNAHVRFFDRERAEMLKSAGCRIVKFGLESGSERVRREIMHRRMSDEKIDEAFKTAHEVLP